jgi:hypothetical protein
MELDSHVRKCPHNWRHTYLEAWKSKPKIDFGYALDFLTVITWCRNDYKTGIQVYVRMSQLVTFELRCQQFSVTLSNVVTTK